MSSVPTVLRDDAARATAIATLNRSLLVEAGAGSGKTAVMAGRVAMLLAEGVAPKSIAAVTFTELAAGELLMRVRAFADALVAGGVPAELAVALPQGLNAQQRQNLERAAAVIDQVTCSTIHGFCQRLILPYPVEANIDPGAAVMDRDHADQVFNELGDQWLWAELDGAGDTLFAHLVAEDAVKSIALVRCIFEQVRKQRALTVTAAQPLAPLLDAFEQCCAELDNFVNTNEIREEETTRRAGCFMQMAQEVARIAGLSGHARLAGLQVYSAHPDLCTGQGAFRAFQAKGKWKDAAKAVGLKPAQGEAQFEQALGLLLACQEAWTRLKQEVAASVLAQLVAGVRPLQERFQEYKRNAALLDFDDLIYSGRALLRDHDDVRRALGDRYRYVLVDEFQDTDPLQSEIVWRLCGDPDPTAIAGDWRSYSIRPGALFLVGDPKQAIYRFRGADIAAYTAARSIFEARGDVLSISTNFRSCAPILDFVNQRFESCLNADGQPGFTPLDPFHAADTGQVCVAALDVEAAGEERTASAEQLRDAEADAVAGMCARMIGNLKLAGRHGADARPCAAGDIALLAPSGSDLWRYEEALERHGIAVATQAGKGFYRRQEVQDLIAICRILAGSRDTIALGALLRGPLVGLTEEQLLDIVHALPAPEDRPDRTARLSVYTDVAKVENELARDVLSKLQSLRRQARSTSPHLLLSQAVDLLRVRPMLLQRHHARAERALANVDKFLSMSQSFAVQGLAAFAAAMTLAWTDESRAAEGQPDAQENAVTLYTMHSAKGLEWPVVVPINTMTRTMAADAIFCERTEQRFCCPVFGTKPAGYDADHDQEKVELERERVRLWYVAATRARELLVLPRLNVLPAGNAWISMLNLKLEELPALVLDDRPAAVSQETVTPNAQTSEEFARETAIIAAASRPLRWRAPSRDEGAGVTVMQEETAALRVAAAESPLPLEPVSAVQGGRARGLVMHKLFEEVLNGEAVDEPGALSRRAAELIVQMGGESTPETEVLSAVEIADCIVRTLRLPEILALRPGMVPEYWVYGSPRRQGDEEEVVVSGIADAICFSDSGQPHVVIDWKSDVDPSASTMQHYRSQVENYMVVTGADRGLVVLATSGRIIEIQRAGPA